MDARTLESETVAMSANSSHRENRLALGLVSPVIGAIGLVLFFLPILSIPLSAIALLLSVLAIVVLIRKADIALRWAFIGLVVSSTSLMVGVAMYYDAIGEVPSRQIIPLWQPVPYRPTVSPPSRQ